VRSKDNLYYRQDGKKYSLDLIKSIGKEKYFIFTAKAGIFRRNPFGL